MYERDLWAWFRDKVLPCTSNHHVQRIEALKGGVPDVDGVINHFQFWMELKMINKKGLKFEPGQREWLRKRWNQGQRAYVLIQVADNGQIYLIPGGLAMCFPLHGKANFATLDRACIMRNSFPGLVVFEKVRALLEAMLLSVGSTDSRIISLFENKVLTEFSTVDDLLP